MNSNTEQLPVVIFRYSGRFGHFLRAEASASALTYPIPPRTVLLGLIGAILGLSKDTPQIELKDSSVAVSGSVPQNHWHRVKLRKDPPTALPGRVKASAAGSTTAPEKATLVKQQWLFNPTYTVTANLPTKYHSDFANRIRERQWYFSPCMGLSEMIAQLDFIAEGTAQPLAQESNVLCSSIVRSEAATLDGREAIETSNTPMPLAILSLRMPHHVSPDRIFTHTNYLIERSGYPIPIRTDQAWQITSPIGTRTVVFM